MVNCKIVNEVVKKKEYHRPAIKAVDVQGQTNVLANSDYTQQVKVGGSGACKVRAEKVWDDDEEW